MDITFNPKAGQISPLRSARFATPEEKETKSAAQKPEDQLEISQQGREASAKSEGEVGFDEMAEELEAYLSSMTKEDFMSMVREQLGEPKQLEINWNAQVDPDGSVWAKGYIDSLVSQVNTARNAIEDYYADAYQDALNSPLGSALPDQLNYIAAKYQCSWSDYFDGSMPADQRQWTYNQVKAMLTGSRVKLNDPFALAGRGLNVKSMDEIARKAATDKIEELIRQAKADAGIVE
ncbi:MAG: hypothetical protein K2M15_11055 [Oscillospiraceae bacterium]|nr:hypothetical protein [Oscillospiraceae bacterium]